jgi:hypothetical protein
VKFKAAIFALALAAGAAQAKAPVWETARVLAQNYDESPSGAYYSGPLFGGMVSGSILRRSNTVDLSTAQYNIRLTEDLGVYGTRPYLVLPVNAELRFYRDGNKYIMIDAGGKKHKFGLVAVQAH